MSSTQREARVIGSDEPASGLEGHLRNLILTNNVTSSNISGNAGNLTAQPRISSPHHPLEQHTEPSTFPASPGQNNADFNYISHGSHSPKPSRRRPNQAQRRQMASQLTITPDPRPQHPMQDHQTRSSSSYQRHMFTNSHPQVWSGPRHSDLPRSHGSWSGPSQGHASNTAGYLNSSPVIHSNTLPSHASRQNTGSFYTSRRPYFRVEEVANQANLLDMLCYQVVSSSEIQRSEIATKEAFRQRIERISREVITRYEQEQTYYQNLPPLSVELKCFGSLSSGFATKASDMDLGLLSPLSKIQPDAPGSPIPRLLEKAFLNAGLGARLLSRTRVPIIKLCEFPPEKLRQGLLAEREKWENGVENELHAGAEEEHDNDNPYHGDDDERTDAVLADANSTSPFEFEVPCGDAGETQRFRLQQGSKHSLSSYYGLAKRILRRAGGRDVTVSNYRDFTPVDWVILNRLCQAFIHGLFDPSLRERLAQYPSFSLGNMSNMSYNRSLLGVSTQVEGEQILQAWDRWPVRESLHIRGQPQDEQMLGLWETLQSRAISDLDPLSYTKELQVALEKIKRIPSIQLLLLEQSQQETPSQYYARTQGIMNNLRFHAEEQSHAVSQAINNQYISGIFHDGIRGEVKNYQQQFPEQSDLQAIGCRHKSLHLAHELERALTEDFYDVAYVPDVEQYISLLRSPLREIPVGPESRCFFVPVASELFPLVKRMKALEHPHKMTPNQPRDRYHDPLEFPKTGVGIQCDINFSAHLALQNTLLLRCYSHADPRVRPMVLFIKHWAKVRGINSGYRGTLSSYGYVLMVLHYLVNVAQPFVCPNLQQLAPLPPPNLSPVEVEATVTCRGYNVQFWRNEQEIVQLALANQLNSNTESIGQLLRGFFEYFAQSGIMSNGSGKGFDWGRDVISLRTHGGLLAKQEKGWTGAKTIYEVQNTAMDTSPSTGRSSASHRQSEVPETDGQCRSAQPSGKSGEVKEVRLRYLFAIEDPFELDHNVARTVTHNGIVSIRDEFRRAWRIIRTVGNGNTQESLLQDVNEVEESPTAFGQLLVDIHGPDGFGNVSS